MNGSSTTISGVDEMTPKSDQEILDGLVAAALRQGDNPYRHSVAVADALGREPLPNEMTGAAMRWAAELPVGYETMHDWTHKVHPTGWEAADLFRRAKERAAEWQPPKEAT